MPSKKIFFQESTKKTERSSYFLQKDTEINEKQFISEEINPNQIFKEFVTFHKTWSWVFEQFCDGVKTLLDIFAIGSKLLVRKFAMRSKHLADKFATGSKRLCLFWQLKNQSALTSILKDIGQSLNFREHGKLWLNYLTFIRSLTIFLYF